MKICFLIPDGVGIRNYLYSDVIKILNQNGHEVVIWHSLGKDQIAQVKTIIGFDFQDFEFKHKPELTLVKFIREAGVYSRLKLNAKKRANPTILTNWMPNKGGVGKKLFYFLIERFDLFFKNYNVIYELEKVGFSLVRKSDSYKEARRFLAHHQPDRLFCTHQRVPSITPAIVAAQDMNIKSSTAIFSWDNLPKARLAFRTDKYFVWSEYMKQELLTYYPEIHEHQIEITSTTQFDFYKQKDCIETRANFALKYGLDPSRKWVCFSGSDSISSPHDAQYLKDVAISLRGQEEVQLIFREVPIESIERFSSVLFEFPEIVNISPEWVKSVHWGSFFPLPSDIKLLVNLAFHCDIVINLGSTMALDFAAFGSTALYLNYDQPQEKERLVKDIYKFEHFQTMKGLEAVGWINSKHDILPKVILAIHNPGEIGPDKKKWFERVVNQKDDETSAQRISKVLLN